MPLHLDYRPNCLEDVVGNKSLKSVLQPILERSDKPHTFLLYGPSGTGKTTIGRIIADYLGCSSNDLYEYNTADMRGIDTVRDIAQNVQYSPLIGGVKVFILDEVHRATKDFQSALLKLLEDTPSHVYFILCTTDPEQLLKTIVNRCSQLQTKLLTTIEMKELLQAVLVSEEVSDFSEKVLKEIIRVSEGCPRQALVILDQVIDLLDEEEALSATQTLAMSEATVKELCQGVINKTSWDVIRKSVALVIKDVEPESIRYAVLGYMTAVLLGGKSDRASEVIDIFSEPTFNTKKAGLVNMFYLASKT